MNAWRAPQRVVVADCPDQFADVGRDRRPADTKARLATPVQMEAAPMPAAASARSRGSHLGRPQRCARPVPSLAPSEQRAKAIPPSTPGPTEVSLCAPRSVQGGKDAEKHRADLDYPCWKPAAAARSPRNDQREGGRPA